MFLRDEHRMAVSLRRIVVLLCFLGYVCLAAGGFEMLKLKKLAKWAIIGRAMQPNVIPIPFPMGGGGYPHPGHIPHLAPSMLPPPVPAIPSPPVAYPVPVPVHHHHHHVVSVGHHHHGDHHHMHSASSKAKK